MSAKAFGPAGQEPDAQKQAIANFLALCYSFSTIANQHSQRFGAVTLSYVGLHMVAPTT